MDDANTIKVLLVDDEDGFRQALSKRLGRRGMDVDQAATGEAALDAMARREAEVVVMDVKMPGMGGLEALGRIKKNHPETEVILLTGQAAVEDGITGIRQGAFDYLQKPISNEHLCYKIRQAASKRVRSREKARGEQMRAALERRMATAERLASLGTLAAGVAHEINNPLAIIAEASGYMSLLMNKKEAAGAPFRDNLINAIDKIEKSVERARRITMQLLGFAGQPDAVMREIDLEELIGEVVLLVNGQAGDKGVLVAQKRGAEPVVVWSDPNRLRQVLVNLASNGIAACQRGGRVTMGVERSLDGALLWVRDNGSGIPNENIEHIFEPFFTTKAPGEGTGLGLFVSLDMVKRLGGAMDVESKIGAGTCFKVSIPLLCKDCPQTSEAIDWLDTAKKYERSESHGAGSDQHPSGG